MRLVPLALFLAACASHRPDDLLMQTVGAEPELAPAPGQQLSLQLQTIDGEQVALPDPQGSYVLVELIRSADW